MDISKEDSRFSEFQNIKRRFFALRNGIVADRLRSAGDPHRLIFGLTLVQIAEVAAVSPPSRGLADMLWANDSTRESRLMAPMIMPVDEFSKADVMLWTSQLLGVEEADILAHRLLRKMPESHSLAEELVNSLGRWQAYTGLRLAFNLLNTEGVAYAPKALSLAQKHVAASDKVIRSLASALAEEAGFYIG